MPRISVLAEFYEICMFAQDKLGYNYNKAFGILENRKPANGSSTTFISWSDYVSSNVNEKFWHTDDEAKIMVSFMVEHNIGEFEIVEDD
jgi:hypothetical protein